MPGLKEVYEIADTIKQVSKPEAIILFGSIARKGEGQDIDLLIVSNRKGEARIRNSLKPFYRRYSIDAFTVSKGRLKELYFRGSPFLRLIQKEGRIIYMKNPLKQWLEGAEEDLRQAEYLYEGGFFRGACYSSQQAAEKIIKWALLKKGWELEKTHSIRRLSAIADDYGIKIRLKDEEIDFIDGIYRGRYPAEEGLLPLGVPTKRDARKAVKIAEKILKQMEAVFGPKKN